MSMQSYRRGARGLWLAGASWLVFAAPATAQAVADETSVEELVVTARKREESLVEVPVSVNVTTAVAIERAGLKDLEDLSRIVPSLVVQTGSEQDSKRFLVRGIGAASGTASTVAVYVDDTPITIGADSPDLKLVDIQRVEVLRGPQGTLFGASSMGGAVRYITPAPQYGGVTGMAKVEGGLTKGDETYEAQGAVGAGLADGAFGLRASAFYRRDAGYVDLVSESTGVVVDKDVNSAETYGGRIALGAKLGASGEAILSVLYQDQKRHNLNQYFTGRGVTTTTPLELFQRTQRSPVGSRDEFFLPTATLHWDFGSVELTASAAYVKRDFQVRTDFSPFVQRALGLPDPFGTQLVVAGNYRRENEAWIQEVRLSSTGEGRLKWQAGIYHQDATAERTQQVTTQNLAALVPPLAGAILPGGGLFTLDVEGKSKQLAGFGELTYAMTEQFELTAGVRVTEVKLGLDRSANGLFNGGPSGVVASSKETPVTPKFSAKYQFSPGAMVYVTAAKGFREGGPNSPVPVGLASCQAALAALGRTDVPAAYKSDNLWSYEIGGKFLSPDRRVQAQVAAFHIDWKEIQQSIGLSGGCGFGFTDNVGKARSDGFEAEATLRPADPLTIELRVGLTRARLAEDLISGATAAGPVVAARSGTRLAHIPKWTAGFAVQYDWTVASDIDAYVRGEFSYIGKATRHLGTPSDDPRSRLRDAYEQVSLRAGAQRGPYEFAVFVDNLLDRHPALFESYQEFAPGTASERTSLRPRTVGASISFRY